MNEFAVTTPKPKDVPRPLAKRSAIDPFIVMDVMGEANARELERHDIIHSSSFPRKRNPVTSVAVT
jgi:hypothetical protein